MTQFDYTITYDPADTAVDITDFVERLECTEIGTGEVNNANFRLNAQDGQFITRDTSLAGVSTPIIDEFDKLRVSITDRDDTTYDRIYEVDNIKPTQNAQQGTVLEVELLGLEHHLQRTQFAKQFFFESAFSVTEQLANFYNDPDTKGDLQPIIAQQDNDQFNTLPAWTANDYTFNITEQRFYDGFTNVVDRVGSSVASGGAGDFWEINFLPDLTDPNFNTINLNAQISGNPVDQQTDGVFDPSKAVTITDSVAVNPAEEEGGVLSPRGSMVGTWGADGFGTLPPENSKFQGALEAWQVMAQSPEAVTSVTYPAGVIFQSSQFSNKDTEGDFFHYKSNKDTTSVPPTPPTSSNADWNQYFFHDFIDNEIGLTDSYSLWTNARANEWKSSCANPDNNDQSDFSPTFDMRAMWDSNLVVVDGDVSRTWADIRAVDVGTIPDQYKRPFSPSGLFYRGFRILIDTTFGTPTGELASFKNGDVVQASGNDGVNNQWSLFRELTEDKQCGIDNEGRVYQMQSDVLQDISGAIEQANDCYHNVYAIFDSQGFNDKNDGAGGNYGEFSAVTHEFRYTVGDANAGVNDEPKYYRIYAGFNFRLPFSHDSYNGNSIGSLYGDNDKLEPATLDTNNLHLSHDGKIGFNHASGIDLGQISAISFALKMEWRYEIDGSGGLLPRGNIPFRCFMYDTSDNVVVQDFTLSYNELWESISLPLSSFKIYRARAGWSLGNTGQNVFLQELEILNVFEFKNVIKIGIQWMNSYDEEGRFTPFLKKNEVFWWFTDFFNSVEGTFVQNYNIKLSVDNFAFSKPLLSLSPPDTQRSLQPDFFQEPNISNSYQLDQANLAILEVMQFQHQQYETTTEGLFDIDFGDTYFLENEFLVNASDNGPNTIQLVAKKITYTIDKPPNGVGGFLRHITGVKRLT